MMKAFVIHLPGREFSNAHATTMVKELRGFGFDVELFAGTEGAEAPEKKLWPQSIKSTILTSEQAQQVLSEYVPNDFFIDYDVQLCQKHPWSDEDLVKVARPGVKGCFDSHYRLWKKCIELKEPIAIFEDDVKFFRGYEPIDFEDVLIVSVGKTSYKDEPYKTFLECPSSTPRPMSWRNYSMPGTSGYIIMPHAARRLVKAYRDWYLPADNAINKSLVTIQIHNYLMGRHMHESEGNVSAL
jgi:GR25 family glycosyltransferase involved in LPS biosynthesis